MFPPLSYYPEIACLCDEVWKFIRSEVRAPMSDGSDLARQDRDLVCSFYATWCHESDLCRLEEHPPDSNMLAL